MGSDNLSMIEVVKKLDEVVDKLNTLTETMNKRESNLYSLVERKVSQYMEEKVEKEKRECNVVFHNIPESLSEDTEERKKFDEERVNEVVEYLDIDEKQEKLKPVRLGKKTGVPEERPRLMKVTLNNTRTRMRVLSNAKKLCSTKEKVLSVIYITPDMTPKEREASKKLREELKKRRLEGEDVIIRGGKIVPTDVTKNSSFRGTRQGEGLEAREW